MESVVYTPLEVSQLLRIRVSKVYEMIKSGDLPAIQIGKNYKIPKEAFDAWLISRTREQRKERKHDTARKNN